MDEHSPEYLQYIQSAEWRARCYRLFKKRGRHCERFGFHGGLIQVHHKTYERLGHELDSDLEIVYERHHKGADKERAELTRRRIDQSRINAWAAKVYGEQWFDVIDFDQAAQEFDQWLETQH